MDNKKSRWVVANVSDSDEGGLGDEWIKPQPGEKVDFHEFRFMEPSPVSKRENPFYEH